MSNKSLLVIGILIGVVLISGCTGQYGQAETTTTLSKETTTTIQATGELEEFTVRGTEYNFNPSSLTVNKGDKVKITFRNVGSTGHNFGISELGVRTNTIAPGAVETIEFTANKKGTFQFTCSVPGHASSGMKGPFNVK